MITKSSALPIVLLVLVMAHASAQHRTAAGGGPVFIENHGQWDQQAKFLLRSPGLDLWITGDGVVYDLHRRESRAELENALRSNSMLDASGMNGYPSLVPAPAHPTSHPEQSVVPPNVRRWVSFGLGGDPEIATFNPPLPSARPVRTAVFMSFVGSLSDAEAEGTDRLPGYHNYFIGNDPSRWAANVPLYGGARLEQIYDGIDAVFYLDEGRPRYDLIVAPGADPRQVKMAFEGADDVLVGDDGSLVIHTELGELEQRGLFAYQMVNGRKVPVECGFTMNSENLIGFTVGAYDRTQPLVIDPLIYSTYLGGSDNDDAFAIVADNAGNAYIAGRTLSTDFPISSTVQTSNSGYSDAFVTKLDSNGTAIVYSTYLGGSTLDQATGVAVDSDGNTYLTGQTLSSDFPAGATSYQATFGGGTNDAFVVKLGSNGSSLLYSTYIGGGQYDEGHAIAVDDNGSAYVTGLTSSTDFPTINPSQSALSGVMDLFVAKLDSDGKSLVYSTYLGGSAADRASSVAVDDDGKAYVTGQTYSGDFPTANAYQATMKGAGSAFVASLNATGNALVYSTYVGGSGNDAGGYGIAVDSDGNAYVTGWTGSSDFPTLNAYQPISGGRIDSYVTKFSSNGTVVYSTYLGGSGNDSEMRLRSTMMEMRMSPARSNRPTFQR